MATGAKIEAQGRVLRLSQDGTSARFHAIWLRDNARDAATRDPGNGQRLITLADLPADPRIDAAHAEDGRLTCRIEGADYDWPIDWLLAHRYDRDMAVPLLPDGAKAWDASLPSGTATALPDLQTGGAPLRDWLRGLVRHGFARVTDVGTAPGGLFAIVDLFGHVRETNYGRLFEVRSEVNPTNLAYTGLGLQAHTDNPYRDPAPTVQVLACLENSAAGGDSAVIDGFAAAQRLQDENPDAFALLTRYPVRFTYSGSAGVHLTARKPMIQLSPDGQLQQIRFNSRSIAPLTDVPFDKMPAFYAAYRALSDIIDDSAMAVTFKLAPGEAFVVDNTRVLHARLGYSGEGSRWLQGCYADMDGVRSTLAALDKELATWHPTP